MPPARSLIIVMRTDSCNSLSPAATQALISPARPGPCSSWPVGNAPHRIVGGQLVVNAIVGVVEFHRVVAAIFCLTMSAPRVAASEAPAECSIP